jgi:hypothetical protein
MQAQFQYVPGSKTLVEQKVNKPAQFDLVVKDRGEKVHLDWDSKGKLIGQKVELWLGEQTSLQICKGKLIIPIRKWGVFSASGYNKELVAVKDELAELCKQLPTLFPATPKVDLLTGQKIASNFCVEFGFSEPKEEIVQVERVIEAKVFFNPLFYVQETIKVDGLCFNPGQQSCVSSGTWYIGRLGWINVPADLDWSVEKIELKFQELAKAIFEKSQTVEWNAPWKFAKTTQICLE